MSLGKIIAVSIAGASVLAIEWDDGKCSRIDLSAMIATHKALAPLADQKQFSDVKVSADSWSLEWPCGIDFGTTQLRRWADVQAGEAMPSADFREWMEANGLTLDGAAKALGLSRRTIAYYLSGEQPVPKTVMLATIGHGRSRAA
jgi:Protein of unknown function (DUF2442)/Helix-turn-helix